MLSFIWYKLGNLQCSGKLANSLYPSQFKENIKTEIAKSRENVFVNYRYGSGSEYDIYYSDILKT